MMLDKTRAMGKGCVMQGLGRLDKKLTFHKKTGTENTRMGARPFWWDMQYLFMGTRSTTTIQEILLSSPSAGRVRLSKD